MQDTITAGYIATIEKLFTISPWAFVVLAFIVVLGLVLRELVRNSKLTEAIASKLTDTTEIKDTVTKIRNDQVQSNTERKKQGELLDSVVHRVTKIEEDIRDIRCINLNCNSRVREPQDIPETV